MANWYDLPAEIKQDILEYLVQDLEVKFIPRHAATRSTTNKAANEEPQQQSVDTDDLITTEEIEEELQEEVRPDASATDSIIALLLVAKNFFTYNELESALLSNAAVSLEHPRDLMKIEKRFTTEGIASIRWLVINTDVPYTWRSAAVTHILPSAKHFGMMKNLKKLTVFCRNISRPSGLTFAQAMDVAQGAHLTRSDFPAIIDRKIREVIKIATAQDCTAAARKELQGFIEGFIRQGPSSSSWVKQLMDEEDEEEGGSYERVLRWNVRFYTPDKKDGGKFVEFSSRHWCVTLRDGEALYRCPQRIDPTHWWTPRFFPTLQRVNDVDADKYYTI